MFISVFNQFSPLDNKLQAATTFLFSIHLLESAYKLVGFYNLELDCNFLFTGDEDDDLKLIAYYCPTGASFFSSFRGCVLPVQAATILGVITRRSESNFTF